MIKFGVASRLLIAEGHPVTDRQVLAGQLWSCQVLAVVSGHSLDTTAITVAFTGWLHILLFPPISNPIWSNAGQSGAKRLLQISLLMVLASKIWSLSRLDQTRLQLPLPALVHCIYLGYRYFLTQSGPCLCQKVAKISPGDRRPSLSMVLAGISRLPCYVFCICLLTYYNK